MSTKASTSRLIEKLKTKKVDSGLPVRRLSITLQRENGLYEEKRERGKTGSAVNKNESSSAKKSTNNRGRAGSLQSKLSDRPPSSHSMR